MFNRCSGVQATQRADDDRMSGPYRPCRLAVRQFCAHEVDPWGNAGRIPYQFVRGAIRVFVRQPDEAAHERVTEIERSDSVLP